MCMLYSVPYSIISDEAHYNDPATITRKYVSNMWFLALIISSVFIEEMMKDINAVNMCSV